LPDVDVPITAGSGTNIRCFQKVSGDYDQYVRETGALAKGTLSNIPWAVTTAGSASVIPADVTRVGLLIVSAATGTVYLRFDSTIPTPLATPPLYDWYLQPGDRYEVPGAWDQLAVSMIGSAAGGYVLASSGTCA
jgi:hypothetical protein